MDRIDQVNRIITGAIDSHAHTGPGIFDRVGDSIDIARQARAYGMRAIVLKCHQGITSDRAILVNKVVPGINVYGGVVLNQYVGGINPHAVEIAIRFGAKIIWMPTQWAQHHINVFGQPEYKHMKQTSAVANLPKKGITILDKNGQLNFETKLVLEIIKKTNVALATGHLSKNEIKILVDEASKMGINKIILTHVTFTELWTWSIEEQKELIKKGTTIEHVAVYSFKNRFLVSVKDVAHMIKEVGYENILVSSDCCQLKLPSPPEGIRLFINMLLDEGIEEKALHYMLKDSPIRLLNLG